MSVDYLAEGMTLSSLELKFISQWVGVKMGTIPPKAIQMPELASWFTTRSDGTLEPHEEREALSAKMVALGMEDPWKNLKFKVQPIEGVPGS